jgi:hypothetical protein
MFFDGTCRDLKSNLFYVVPVKKPRKSNDLLLDLGSYGYKISFKENNDKGSCEVIYESR